MSKVELITALEMAMTGKGSEMLPLGQAKKLVDFAAGNSKILVRAEVFELSDDIEIPRTDLTLYGLSNEEDIKHLDEPSKVLACQRVFSDLIDHIENEKAEFGFRLWFE